MIVSQFYINLITILVFTIIIFNTKQSDWNTHDNRKLSFLDSLYFCLTSFSTMGFGDITPSTKTSKIIVLSIQTFLIFEILFLYQNYVNGSFKLSFLKKIVYLYLTLLLFTLYFYFFTNSKDWYPTSQNKQHNIFDLFYFSNTSLTSCGYGDIYPITNSSKIPVMLLQIILVFQVLSFFS